MIKVCICCAVIGVTLEIGNRFCIARNEKNPSSKYRLIQKGINGTLKYLKMGVGSYAVVKTGINLMKER